MPDHPLWFLPAGRDVARPPGAARAPKLRTPDEERQGQRLGPRLARLQEAMDTRRLRLAQTMEGAEPELVLVLEVAGSVADFAAAVQRIDGLEWLLEAGDLDLDDEEFGAGEGDRYVGKTLYLLFTDALALQQLRTMWDRWQRDERQRRGHAPFRRLFEQLVNIRPWGPRDRVRESGLLERLEELAPNERVRVQVELWHRHSAVERQAADDRVTAAIGRAQGTVLARAALDQIRYHGLLAELPVERAQTLVEEQPDIELGVLDDVMYFRPLPQGIEPGSDGTVEWSDAARPPAPETEAPVVALLDGVAQANHPALQGLITVEDPDGHEAHYTVGEMAHGTAMASLVTRGDLSADPTGLARPVLLRPILLPDPHAPDWVTSRAEVFPPDELPVDVLHRALHELFEGTPDRGPSASSVRVVNLSIGDSTRVFAGVVSPMARLLDWAAARYDVLFVVSAGNHPSRLELDCTAAEADNADDIELESHTLRVLHRNARLRRLLAPGEAANALTVGAAPDDAASPHATDPRRDPIATPTLPAAYSALGRGVRRSLKPDVLHAGGRLRCQIVGHGSQTAVLEPSETGTQPPGVLVAASGGITRPTTRYEAGTSHAAALTTRFAARLHATIESMSDHPEWVHQEVWPALLKALVVHAGRWGAARGAVAQALPGTDGGSHQRFTESMIGHGRVDPDELFVGDPNRVVLLGGGTVFAGEAMQHEVPLPASLNAIRGKRRVVTTLAWITPCNSRHQRYRGVRLQLDDHGLRPLSGMASEQAAGHHASRRGTVEHHVKSSVKATPIASDAALQFRVDCTNDAINEQVRVPYALVVTIEVAPQLGIDVHSEVTARLRPRVPIDVSP